MNDPAVKLTLALSILLGGFLAAIAFRPDRNVSPSDVPSWAELAAIRNRRQHESTAATVCKESSPTPIPLRPQAANAATPKPTMLAPLDDQPPIPSLPPKYPGDGLASSTGGGMPLFTVKDNSPAEKSPRLHKIADGDTLPALAARYLGSPDRAMEIFKANREVLSDPDLLPIGGELKIPCEGLGS